MWVWEVDTALPYVRTRSAITLAPQKIVSRHERMLDAATLYLRDSQPAISHAFTVGNVSEPAIIQQNSI